MLDKKREATMSLQQLYQIIPTEVCLSCDVCCRFLDKDSPLAPIFTENETGRLTSKGIDRTLFQRQKDGKSNQIALIPHEDYYICPFFEPETHHCKIYASRPLDCRLYPFTIMFSKDRNSVVLGVDMLCPYSEEHYELDSFQQHLRYVIDYVESEDVSSQILENWSLIGEFQDTVKVFHTIRYAFEPLNT